MAYQFAGFLVPTLQDILSPQALPPDAICRQVGMPFTGIGVRIPSLLGKRPSPSHVNSLAEDLGISKAASWLYITYDTWGSIDSVHALGVQDGDPFGPVDDSDARSVKDTFVQAMSRIGVSREEALDFAPFRRGFWAPQA